MMHVLGAGPDVSEYFYIFCSGKVLCEAQGGDKQGPRFYVKLKVKNVTEIATRFERN